MVRKLVSGTAVAALLVVPLLGSSASQGADCDRATRNLPRISP